MFCNYNANLAKKIDMQIDICLNYSEYNKKMRLIFAINLISIYLFVIISL